MWIPFVNTETSLIDYHQLFTNAQSKYPYIDFGDFEEGSYLDDDEIQKAATYINAMNFYIESTVQEKELVAA